MDRIPHRPIRRDDPRNPQYPERVRQEIEVLDRLRAARVALDAMLAGHWAADEDTIAQIVGLLEAARLHARATTITGQPGRRAAA